MKKRIVMIIITLAGLQLWAQGSPIKPLKEDGYSLSKAKTFIKGHSELSINFRKEMLKIIQSGLSEAGESLVLDEKNFPFILERIQYKNIQLNSGYINSRKAENKIEFFPNKKSFVGEVGIFVFDKTKVVLFKTTCLNLLKIPQKDIFFVKKNKDSSLVKKEQKIVKKDGTTTIINNYYYNSEKSLVKKELKTTLTSKSRPTVIQRTETKYVPVPVYYPTTRYVDYGYRNYYRRTIVGSILSGFTQGIAEGLLYRGYGYVGNYYYSNYYIHRNYRNYGGRYTRKGR